MGWPDYRASVEIAAKGYSFSTIIMAAMRKADTDNLEILTKAWPEIEKELRLRYKAPGGFLTEREVERFDEP